MFDRVSDLVARHSSKKFICQDNQLPVLLQRQDSGEMHPTVSSSTKSKSNKYNFFDSKTTEEDANDAITEKEADEAREEKKRNKMFDLDVFSSDLIGSNNNQTSFCGFNSNISFRDSNGVASFSAGSGRSRCDVGLAYLEYNSMQLQITELSDTSCYRKIVSKINTLMPSMIIYPSNLQSHPALEVLKSNFGDIHFQIIEKKRFNEENGVSLLQRYSIKG